MKTSPLSLFNSLGRTLGAFKPVDPDVVRLYSCGPTVYNDAHIGNLRAYVFVDTLRRALQWKGYDVVHVMNVTDVGHLTSDADEGDDKMEKAAAERKRTVWDVAAHYTEAFQEDLRRLNVQPPSLWAKATDHIQEMIAFAVRLEECGAAYVLKDGVYFDTSRVPDYGAVGRLELSGQQSGHRVFGPEGKRNPSDFAVWRFSPADKKRLMEWNSPWGIGAPGWHLECSVMSMKYLGRKFDIHTGGIDHRQVHHCNEIAQNQAYNRSAHSGANWWMHNEFLTLRQEGGRQEGGRQEGGRQEEGGKGEKMSKSSGNFLTLQTLVDAGVHPLAYRLFLLTASYRSPLEFSWEALAAARAHLRRLSLRVSRLREEIGTLPQAGLLQDARHQRGGSFAYLRDALCDGLGKQAACRVEALDAALSDDLHTPRALVVLGEVLDDKTIGAAEKTALVALFDLALGLDLLRLTPDGIALRPRGAAVTEAEIEALIAERNQARRHKDFGQADAIRDKLLASGIEIKDAPQGTEWEWRLFAR